MAKKKIELEKDTLLTNPLADDRKPIPLPAPGEDIDVSRETAQQIKTMLLEMYRVCEADNAPMNRRIENWWDEFYQGTEYTNIPNAVMENASNVHVPLLQWVVSGTHAQLTQQSFGTDPAILVLPGKSGDPVRADRLEGYFENLLEEELDWPSYKDENTLFALMEGAAITYCPWEENRELMYRRMDPNDDYSEETAKSAKYHGYIPEFEIGDELLGEGPNPQIISRNRFHLYPTDAYDIQKADAVFLDYEVSRNHLVRSKKNNEYPLMEDDDWKLVLENMQRSESKTKAVQTRDNKNKPVAASHTKVSFNAIECFFLFDADEDGELEPCIATILEETETLLCIRLSEYAGRRPFIRHTVLPSGKNLYAPCFGQLLDWAMHVLNTLINMKINDGNLRHLLIRSIIFDSQSGFDPNKWKIGDNLQVDDISHIKSAAEFMPPDEQDQIQFMEYIVTLVTRLIGLSDQFLGRNSPGTQTATETSALVNLGSTRFEQMMQRNSRGDKDLMYWIMILHYYFMPDDEIVYYVTASERKQLQVKQAVSRGAQVMAQQMGQNPQVLESQLMEMMPQKGVVETKYVERNDFTPFPPVAFFPQGSKANMNKDVIKRDAIMIWNMLNQDPYYMMNSPYRYEILLNLIRAMGLNVDKMAPPKPMDGPVIPPQQPEPPEAKGSISVSLPPELIAQLPQEILIQMLVKSGLIDPPQQAQGPSNGSIDGSQPPNPMSALMSQLQQGQGSQPSIDGGDVTNPNIGPPLPVYGGAENDPMEMQRQLAAQSRQNGNQGG